MDSIEIKNQTFEFRENGQPVKTMKIPFEVLSNSKEFIPASGKPQASRPEASWIAMQKVISLLDLRNIVNRIDAIYVSSDEANHPLTTEEKALYGDEIPVKMWIFNRIIARIVLTIPDAETPEGMESAIAFAYNKNGIQIAFGTNVQICSNFSILRYNETFQTYGDKKIPYEDLMAHLAQFIDNLPQWQAEEFALIQKMQDTDAGTLEDINGLIGALLRAAVNANLNAESSALNITEVAEMTRTIISEPVTNVWDLYNVGTKVLNFGGKVNLLEVVDKHIMWRNVIFDKYQIEL